MKVAIPSVVENPTIDSEVAECPIAAKSVFIFDLGSESQEVLQVEHQANEICSNVERLASLGVTAFVSGSCCKEHFAKFRDHGIEVYKCTSCKIRDMIQAFVLGGAFIRRQGDEMVHPA